MTFKQCFRVKTENVVNQQMHQLVLTGGISGSCMQSNSWVAMILATQPFYCIWQKPSVRTEVAVSCKKQTARPSPAKACPSKQIVLLACRSDDRQRDAHLHTAQVACLRDPAGPLCEAAAEVSAAGADHLWGC